MYDDNFYHDKEKETKHMLAFWAMCAVFAAFTVIGAITVIRWLWSVMPSFT